MVILENNASQPKGRSLLPPDYRPSPNTVIVGRGRVPKQNMGNKRMVALALQVLTAYEKGGKRMKTQIVSDILSNIYEACPTGGAFVRHAKDGRWYEVPHPAARERVGYVFRDLLADKYKSSSKSKVERRRNLLREDDNESQSTCTTDEEISLTSTTTGDSSVQEGDQDNFFDLTQEPQQHSSTQSSLKQIFEHQFSIQGEFVSERCEEDDMATSAYGGDYDYETLLWSLLWAPLEPE